MKSTFSILSTLLFLLFLTSCKEQKKELNFTSFEGHGNEPGWLVRLYKKDSHWEYNLLLDYGEIKRKGLADISQSETGFMFILKQPYDKITGTIRTKSCVDDAGINYPNEIELKYNDRTYLGCGSFQLPTLTN